MFAGHIHREENDHLNGLTQVTGRATKGQPLYYLVERARTADGGDALVVQRVVLPVAGSDAPPTRDDVAVIPLGRKGPGTEVGPLTVKSEIAAAGGAIAVDVTAKPAAVSATAKLYPQGVFGGTHDAGWTGLTRAGNRWIGTVTTPGLPPGIHRVQVRVEDETGAGIEHTQTLVHPGDPEVAKVAWEIALGGHVQGALASHDGLVVAASTSGTVVGLRPRGAKAGEQWRVEVGPVHRGPAFAGDGAVILVPSADHHLHALDASTGARRWSRDLGSPALSSPVVGEVSGTEVVALAAGDRLVLLDTADGRIRWDVEIPVMSAGRPAIDGHLVIAGAGDGKAYAVDAATGERLWSFTTNTRTTAYTRLIYGPWDDTIELLPDGGVLVSTVSGAWALDRSTGEQRWRRSGSYIYAPALTVGDRALLLTDELGRASLVDPATGAATWTTPTAPRVLNAGPVLVPGGERALLVGTGGLLVTIDLRSGAATPLRQLFTANTFSTPALVDGAAGDGGPQLVVGAQDGVVRGIVGATGA
ncbi:PQQ-binding-like beta-propeller repeat protein [Janibacter sp. G1551]|uniref:outer membrane protein assembly factor BamB family protein n=1 Tax=Janibacter sp. G1551 TaxID=3420440 RepID=UPI003D087224